MKFKPLLLLWVLLCVLSAAAWAQNKTITGKVTDKKDGSPLIGVSVMAKGTNLGGNTDAEGAFKINVPAGTTTLVVSYVGYTRQEVPIGSRTTVNIALTSESTSLNEVVVIGYGTQRVKDATGSVASLGTKEFNKGVIATPEQLLQGRVSGVQVTPASGEPGAGATINIRGTSAIRAGNGPLYVVDGVPLDNGGTSSGFDNGSGSSSARNPLAFINPNDIENISILKDASAAAIYGSRGANGVVLITTKKGAKGQGINFTATTSATTIAKKYDLLNASQFLAAVAAAGADATAVNFNGNTNWQDQIFRTGISQNYNLGFGGAKDGGSYRATVSYDNINGSVKKSGLQRMTGRVNASQSLFKDKIKFDLAFTYSNLQNTFAPITNNAGFEGSLIGAVLQSNPTYPIRNANGTYFTPGGAYRNPVAMIDLIDDSDNINRYLGNLSGTWNITKELSFKSTFGYDRSKGLRSTWLDPGLPGYTGTSNIRNLNVSSVTGLGRGVEQNLKLTNRLFEQTLNYDKKFADNSSLTALAGFSYQEFLNYGYNIIGYNTTAPASFVKNISAFQMRTPIFGDSTKAELQSFFGRVNYSYKDKYLVTATLRADGSSKFGENNKYGLFPAFAFKWKILNEDFGPKSTFDDLSLRLNYGQTGNQEFPSYSSQALKQYNFDGSVVPITAPNPNLKWQTDTQFGAGIDFSLVKGRLSGTLDYFNKSTKNLLFLQDYAQPTAISRRWVNLPGKIINSGVELGLNFQALQKEKFTWGIQYNMTFLHNTIKDFGNRNVITGNIDGQGLSGAYAQIITNGSPLYSFNVPVFGGFDANGLGIYPSGDQGQILGSALPKFTAGLTNNFNFGKFDASVFINASTGFYIYNNTANAFFIKGLLLGGRNVTVDVANSQENPLNSGEVSSRFLEKGDFIRLSNASLGYTFGLDKSKVFKSLRISVSGQNLVLLTKYSGLDPEINTNKERNGVPSRGIDYTAYPSSRIFTFGLNVGL